MFIQIFAETVLADRKEAAIIKVSRIIAEAEAEMVVRYEIHQAAHGRDRALSE
jgi:hypothetical protein